MAFDHSNHAKKIGMKKGETRNPNGSPTKVRITKSPLRKTAESLREVEEDALKAIKLAVKGQEVDKTQLETAKWLIGMIQTIDKSASQEEVASAKIRLEAKKAQENGAGPDEVHQADVIDGKSKFSLVLQKPQEDSE